MLLTYSNNCRELAANLTVVILTKNEEKNITSVIKNAMQVTDKVLIVDSGSTDKTVELAKDNAAKVIYRAWNDDFAAQRNFALEHVHTKWVLYLDADERMDLELSIAIVNAVKDSKEAMYRFIRYNNAFGRSFRYGVLAPAIARPRTEGGYELVAGHRRHHASELAGKETMPVIVRELDDDAAVILMVDSNLQRERILPSERAFAYKMKMDAIRHQGSRSDLTSGQVVQKLSLEQIAEGTGESYKQVQRYIRLTELIPELLKMVDEGVIKFNPAVELSFLKKEEQENFIEAMDYSQNTPSLSQAQRLKKLSQDGKCTLEAMCAVMDEQKKEELDKVVIKNDVLKKYFPKSYTPKQMESTIIKLLEQWQKKRNREMSL